MRKYTRTCACALTRARTGYEHSSMRATAGCWLWEYSRRNALRAPIGCTPTLGTHLPMHSTLGCSRLWLAADPALAGAATSAPGLRSLPSLPHLHRDWANPLPPHPHREWAYPSYICTGTMFNSSDSASKLASPFPATYGVAWRGRQAAGLGVLRRDDQGLEHHVRSLLRHSAGADRSLSPQPLTSARGRGSPRPHLRGDSGSGRHPAPSAH